MRRSTNVGQSAPPDSAFNGRELRLNWPGPAQFFASFAVGVGSQDPDSLSLVIESGVVRSQHSPLRIEPQRGQVSEDHFESSAGEKGRVFEEGELRPNLPKYPGDVLPESGLRSGDPRPGAGGADILARPPGRDDIDPSAPLVTGEGLDIVPDLESWEGPVALSGEEDVSGVLVDFASDNCGPPEETTPQD